eukprot:s810_g5.t1
MGYLSCLNSIEHSVNALSKDFLYVLVMESLPEAKSTTSQQREARKRDLARRMNDGKECRSCQSFALTIEDLDYPNGMGSGENHVHNIFWVANIPGDWMAINQTAVTQLGEFAPTMVVGRNSQGALSMEAPCPKRGMHRYHVVMWSLDSQLEDIDSDISYQALKSLLEAFFTGNTIFYAPASDDSWPIAATQHEEASLAGLPGTMPAEEARLTAEALAQLEEADDGDATGAPKDAKEGKAAKKKKESKTKEEMAEAWHHFGRVRICKIS